MRLHHTPWVVIASVLAACGGSDDSTGDTECVSDARFFQESISIGILEKTCMACHTAQGQANQSDLVLLGAGETNYLQENLATVRSVAELEIDGTSLLLLKPSGQVPHGGGPIITQDSDEYRALEKLLARFDNPVVCESDVPGGGLLERVQIIDLPEVLRKAKLQLVGELPSPEELAQVSEGGEPVLDALLLGYMEEDPFYVTLKRWWNDDLLTDKYVRGDDAVNLLDADEYPNRKYYEELPDGSEERRLARRWANQSVAREPLDLIAHVVRTDRPFTEILTADYMLLNPFSARVYGVDGGFADDQDPTEFKELHIPGIPHAGILTSPMFLNRFSTTDTNRNRHRSRMVYDLFLATDILKKAEQPVDPTLIADHNPTMNNSQCTVCHTVIDPLAGSFLNWDARGRYRIPEDGWYNEMRPPGFGKEVLPTARWDAGLQWAAKRIVADERFALSAVYSIYKGLIGRDPQSNPTDQDDPRYAAKLAFYNLEQAFLREATDNFISGGYKIKQTILTVVKSPWYRARSATGLSDDDQAALAPLGTMRLLTPEELDAKLIATIGYPWRRRLSENNQLLNPREYYFFYGGMDSDQVTRRITEPNGIMANVQLRMANEMSCYSVARDLREAPEDRVLFPHVELSYTPEDANGFEVPQAVAAIRKNIRYLHHRLLGEVLTPGHPEEQATYKLFLQTWREGYQARRNDQVPRDIPGRCRATWDFYGERDLPEEERLYQDQNYTIRAWMAVITYLLADWRFLYHQ